MKLATRAFASDVRAACKHLVSAASIRGKAAMSGSGSIRPLTILLLFNCLKHWLECLHVSVGEEDAAS